MQTRRRRPYRRAEAGCSPSLGRLDIGACRHVRDPPQIDMPRGQARRRQRSELPLTRCSHCAARSRRTVAFSAACGRTVVDARACVSGMDVCAHLFGLKVRASGATSTVTSALSLGRCPSGSAAESPSAAPRTAPPRRTSAVGATQRPIALPKGARLRCATQRAAQRPTQTRRKRDRKPAGRAACLLSRRCRRSRQDRRRKRPSPPAHRGGT
jgi:hypothetical protein